MSCVYHVVDNPPQMLTNGEALKALREGLEKPSQVPLSYDPALSVEMKYVQDCRQLFRLQDGVPVVPQAFRKAGR